VRDRLSVVFEDVGRPGDGSFIDRWHRLRSEGKRLGLVAIHVATWPAGWRDESPPPGDEGAEEGRAENQSRGAVSGRAGQ
jgi:hypothetical protein